MTKKKIPYFWLIYTLTLSFSALILIGLTFGPILSIVFLLYILFYTVHHLTIHNIIKNHDSAFSGPHWLQSWNDYGLAVSMLWVGFCIALLIVEWFYPFFKTNNIILILVAFLCVSLVDFGYRFRIFLQETDQVL